MAISTDFAARASWWQELQVAAKSMEIALLYHPPRSHGKTAEIPTQCTPKMILYPTYSPADSGGFVVHTLSAGLGVQEPFLEQMAMISSCPSPHVKLMLAPSVVLE